MPLLAPRIQSDVWKTIKNYHQHNASEWESQYRKDMGIPDDEPLPAQPNLEYPKMVYSEGYFSTSEPDEQAGHVQVVHGKEQEDALVQDGWHPDLQTAKKAYYASKDQASKSKK